MKRNYRLTLVAIIATLAVAFGGPAFAGLGTQDFSTLTPTDLANSMVGAGVTISNVTYTGSTISAGKFNGGTGIIGFDQGVILSSGNIANVIGPNVSDYISADLGFGGDTDLTSLSGFPTLDATVLEFDFVPNTDKVFFQYVFTSDEYNEWVNTQFNDVFAFFVNGVNCATVGGLPVSINTINNGNPFGALPNSHPELYINNDLSDGGGAIDTGMDGLTVVLLCQASVTPNATNHIKLAIADASDHIYDSNVFLRAGSFSTTPPTTACALSQGYWKTHASFWPVNTLFLGSQSYTQDELLSLLSSPVKGNASLILAKQLIAADLNVAHGVNPTPVNATITNANNLLSTFSGKLPYAVKPSSSVGKAMTSDAAILDPYNNNLLTPNCEP